MNVLSFFSKITRFFDKSVLIRLSLAFFFCAIFIDLGHHIFYDSSDYVMEKIKLDVRKVSNHIQSYLPILKKNIGSRNKMFTLLNDVEFTCDLVLVKNNNIIYWSNNELTFIDKESKNTFTEKCIVFNGNIYLVKQVQFNYENEHYKAFFIILIHRGLSKQHNNQFVRLHNTKKTHPLVSDLDIDVVLDKTLDQNQEGTIAIKNSYGLYLFSVIKSKNNFSIGNNLLSIATYILMFILLVLSFILYSISLFKIKNKKYFSIILCSVLIILKIVLFEYNLLEHILNTNIFGIVSSDVFVNLDILGSYLFNHFIIYILLLFFSRKIWNFIKQVLHHKSFFLKYVCLGIGLLLIDYMLFRSIHFIHYISFNLNVNLELYYNIDFQYSEIISILTILISFINCFLVINLVANAIVYFLYYQGIPSYSHKYSFLGYFKTIFTHLLNKYLLIYIIVMISIPLLFYRPENLNAYVIIFMGLGSLFYCIFSKLYNIPYKKNYKMFFYISVFFVLSSILISYLFYSFTLGRNKYQVNEIISGLSLGKDFRMHSNLNRVSTKINQDVVVQQLLSGNLEQLKDFILNRYLQSFTQDFDINFYIFDNDNLSIEPKFSNYDSLTLFLYRTKYATPSKGIYLVKSNQYSYAYWSVIHLQKGTIIINFKVKNIYTNIFEVSTTLNKYIDVKKRSILLYDYAIFFNNYLLKSSQGFPYRREFERNEFYDYKKNSKGKYVHTVSEITPNNYIVVTHIRYSFSMILTIFSFWFFIFILYMFLYNLTDFIIFKNFDYNTFNMRIYYVITFIFIFPLICITFLILKDRNKQYNQDVLNLHFNKIVDISRNIYDDLSKFTRKEIDKKELSQILKNIENRDKVIISLYGMNGHSLYTSPPFEFKRINNQVYSSLIEQSKEFYALKGNFNNIFFNNVYNSVRYDDFAHPLGIIAVSFFDLYYNYQKNLFENFSIFFKTFSLIYIITLLAANLVLSFLSSPLTMISRKLLSTSLEDSTKLMDYKTNDEIGAIVQSYNKMVTTLRESKTTIKETEKHNAWREIAQHVAHEVKNPLTPIKLTLQNVKRLLGKSDYLKRINHIKQNIDNVLIHIDTVANIVNSFSEFSKMPLPNREKVNITQILRNVITLHLNNPNIIVTYELPDDDYYCITDTKLFSRILNNLIINSIEAVDESTKPYIRIYLARNQTGMLIISIKDNGRGIPEDISKRIYMPNFTTKERGSGIGLAIASQGIKHWGGSIWHESKIGKGSTFYIQIPLLKEKKE